MSGIRHPRLAFLVFAAALLFRLGMYAVIPPPGYSTDSKKFYEVADSIAEGNGFSALLHGKRTPLAHSEPGYSLFLAFWKILGLGGIRGIILIQIVLAALLAPVIFSYVARRADPPAALAASLLYAFDPLAAGACFFILRELFVMAVVLAAVSALDVASRRGFLIKGFLLGLSGLSFAVYTLWSAFLWILDRRFSRAARRVGAATLLFSWLVAGAWMARNAVMSDGNMLIRRSSNAILLFFTAHYDFRWIPDTQSPEFQNLVDEAYRRFGIGAMENLRDYERAVLQATWEKFRSEPFLVAGRFFKANFWFWVEVPGSLGFLRDKPVLHRLMLFFHWAQLSLAVAAVVLLWTRARTCDLVFVWGTIVYLALFVFPFMPIPRYYTSILPLIDILAGYGFVSLICRRASSKLAVARGSGNSTDP